MRNTLAYRFVVCKGSLWALYIASVQYGPLQTLAYSLTVYVGLIDKPL